MSIEVELHGKAGRLCSQAQAGEIRCPLIVRSTSEDVLVGNVFGSLRHIRPHLWLNPLLNLMVDGHADSGRFRQLWFRDFSMKLWQRQARFPPELLTFREGRTEPDVVIEWENPATTVWIEAKYLSGFSSGTANAEANDQVVRCLRTLLADTGHLRPSRLFNSPTRKCVFAALLSESSVEAVRHVEAATACVAQSWFKPESARRLPFDAGVISWGSLRDVLRRQHRHMNRSEASLTSVIEAYTELKSSTGRRH